MVGIPVIHACLPRKAEALDTLTFAGDEAPFRILIVPWCIDIYQMVALADSLRHFTGTEDRQVFVVRLTSTQLASLV
jgi:hypothetical protein